MPRVSVVMPLYNAAAFVGDAEIDNSKVTPASETFADLDSAAKSTIDKMLFDQEMKEKNKLKFNY